MLNQTPKLIGGTAEWRKHWPTCEVCLSPLNTRETAYCNCCARLIDSFVCISVSGSTCGLSSAQFTTAVSAFLLTDNPVLISLAAEAVLKFNYEGAK